MTWGQIRLQAQKWAPAVDLDVLDQAIQARYSTILDRMPWKALDKAATIQTVGVYATGTVAVTAGSASIVGTGTNWVTGQTGMSVRFGLDAQSYVFSWLTGTTGTLDRPYEGTNAAASAYYLFQSVYPLPADLKILLEVNNIRGNFPLRPYTQSDLNMLYPSRPAFGEPFIYSMAADNSATPPLHQVELYLIPQFAAGYSIRYTQNPPMFDPTVTTASPLPWIPQQVLVNGVRSDVLAFAKDYEGMKAFEGMFQDGLEEMVRVELHRQSNARTSEAARYDNPTGGKG